MNEAKHASAPPGYKCSDCTMDDEPCPRCYTAWWQARHPDTCMVSVGDSELNALRAELAAVKQDAERYRWLRSRHPPGVMNIPRIWSGPPWDETATLWWEHGADAAIDTARAQAGGK